MVKRIELDDNLTDAEKEQLLRNHEFNLNGIDGIMNEERKIQDQSLEKAIKDRLERRQRLLEKRNKKDIKDGAKKVENDVEAEMNQRREEEMKDLDEKHKSKVNDALALGMGQADAMTELEMEKEREKRDLELNLAEE